MRLRRTQAGALVVLGALLGAGCNKHQVAATNACPAGAVHHTVVVSNRGAIGLARVGLTPADLKAQQKC